MPTVTVNSNVGDAAANSYCSLVEATAYWLSHVQDDSFTAWNAATPDPQQNAALVQAATLLDSCFIWTGFAATASQALGWPRTSMLSRNGYPIDPTSIPRALKNAQAELAGQLLAQPTRTADNDALKLNLSSVRAGSVGANFDTIGRNSGSLELRDADVLRAGPDFDFLWKAVPDAVRNQIVASWYKRTTVSRPLIFNPGI